MGIQRFFKDPSTVTGLAWGLHAPFREYMSRMSDGTITALGDAEMLSNDETYFPFDAQRSTADVLRFTGTLQFTGHHGMLVVTIKDPWLERTEAATILTIIDPFDGRARMALVVTEFQDDNTANSWLTEAGTDLFMDNYPKNMAFDPLRMLCRGKD